MAAAGIQADKADRLPASALLRPEKQLTSQGFEGDFTDTPDFQRASVLRDGETGAQGEDTPLTDATTVSQESSAVGSLRSLSHDYPSSAPALYSQGASGRQSTLGRTPFLSGSESSFLLLPGFGSGNGCPGGGPVEDQTPVAASNMASQQSFASFSNGEEPSCRPLQSAGFCQQPQAHVVNEYPIGHRYASSGIGGNSTSVGVSATQHNLHSNVDDPDTDDQSPADVDASFDAAVPVSQQRHLDQGRTLPIFDDLPTELKLIVFGHLFWYDGYLWWFPNLKRGSYFSVEPSHTHQSMSRDNQRINNPFVLDALFESGLRNSMYKEFFSGNKFVFSDVKTAIWLLENVPWKTKNLGFAVIHITSYRKNHSSMGKLLRLLGRSCRLKGLIIHVGQETMTPAQRLDATKFPWISTLKKINGLEVFQLNLTPSQSLAEAHLKRWVLDPRNPGNAHDEAYRAENFRRVEAWPAWKLNKLCKKAELEDWLRSQGVDLTPFRLKMDMAIQVASMEEQRVKVARNHFPSLIMPRAALEPGYGERV